jgi:hypothetical protein
MENLDKIHERVLEMQKNIENVSPEEQANMINELINIASQIEQSLSDINLDVNETEKQTNEEHD